MLDEVRPGILFDVDGTLVDTNYLHVLAWWRAFRDQGRQVEMARIHRQVGKGSDRLTEALLGRESAAASEAHSRHYSQLSRQALAFPAAAALLREVKRRGAQVVLATSAKAEELETIRRALDADDAVDEIVSSQDAGESKPAPDIFEVALRKAGLDRDACAVVGDSRWDVEAAGRLGLPAVCVLSGGTGAEELWQAGAAAVYEDVGELLRKLDESPLAGLFRAAA